MIAKNYYRKNANNNYRKSFAGGRMVRCFPVFYRGLH